MEELGLNQTNSNSKLQTNVPESPDSAAHDSSTFSSFPFPVSLGAHDPFPLNELFGASNNELHQNNILDCPQLANENANAIAFAANQNTNTAAANHSTSVATSAFSGFGNFTPDLAENMQQARSSFFNATITTTQQYPETTAYNPQHVFNAMLVNQHSACLPNQHLFQPVGSSLQNANVLQAQQLFQPAGSILVPPQPMFSPVGPSQQQVLQPMNPGYGFNNLHSNQQNGLHGQVAQAQQMLQTQYNLNRMHQSQQNVFPGNVTQPHQMLMGQQMNQSTLNNQLFHNATNNNFSNFQSPTSQYANWFSQNTIGVAERLPSLYGNQPGKLFVNNNNSSSSRSQDLSGQLNHQQAEMTPMMPSSPMHSGPQQSFHQVLGRPVGLFQQGPHPIRPPHSVPIRPRYIPQQILMAANANNLLSQLSVDSSQDNQNPFSIFLAEIDNPRLKHPRSACFQLRLPNSPILPRPGQQLNNPEESSQALPIHDLVNKRKHTGTQIKDQPIIPSMSSGFRAGVVEDDQQLVDVPILAHDSEKANSLLPGQSSRPPPSRPQTIEVEAVYLEDSSPVNSHQSRVEKENSSNEEMGLLATDTSEAKLTAPEGKKAEDRECVTKQFASIYSSEEGGIGAETHLRKKAKRAQEGSSAAVPSNPSEQNGSQNSAFPMRMAIENKVYDPEYEAMGLPVDPHLRMFVSMKK